MSEQNRSPAQIEAEIGRTRSELGQTLDALERRLNARHLLQEGLTMVTESMGTDSGVRPRFAEAMRANPLPLALIGVGVAWLLAGNTGLLDRVVQDERVQTAVRQVTQIANTLGNTATTGGPGVGTTGGDGWVHRAAGATRGAVGAVRDTGSVVIERAGDYAGYAGQRATRVAEQASQTWERNALLFGAAGLIAGVLAAALLPLSSLETEPRPGTTI